MANKSLFRSARSVAPVADTTNLGGGKAYKFSAKHALAQIAMTGTFNGTFYAKPEDILDLAKKMAQECADDPAYIARVAIAAREQGYMKDMPAFLVTMLGELDTGLFRRVFPRVIDNGKMLRNVIQMARSGQIGKPRNLSAGAYRKAIQAWFDNRSPLSIFKAAIGDNPSMRDILRMARPKPNSAAKAALFAYLKGAELENGAFIYRRKGEIVYSHAYDNLPDLIRQYEAYKHNKQGMPPDVDFRYLDSLGLDKAAWTQIAINAAYQMTLQNLNTFNRHGVFEDKKAVQIVADRIRNEDLLRQARIFPYRLLVAWKAASEGQPHEIQEALQDAMEAATAHVPVFGGKVYILIDVSGSMRWGMFSKKETDKNWYGGWNPCPTIPRVVDVAAMFAASLMRANHNCEVFAFSNVLHECRLNPRDTVLTNANLLAGLPAGGTNCSLPLAYLNQQHKTGDAVIYLSDYESWIDTPQGQSKYSDGTKTHQEWLEFKKRSKHAKLICMDLTPRDNGQVKERPDILQVGGFSDQVFTIVKDYIEMETPGPDVWVKKIQEIEIDRPADAKAV